MYCQSTLFSLWIYMKIFNDKPKNRIEPANGSFLDNTVTWSDPNYTWSDISVNWGGFYGQSDESPVNVAVESTKSKIEYSEFKPINVFAYMTKPRMSLITDIGFTAEPPVPGATSGQPYGLLLVLTQP